MNALVDTLAEQVTHACESGGMLRIVGGDSKAFYGGAPVGDTLSLADHRGVVSYEPTELVVTVRSGTPLAELQAALAGEGQMLAFEPPAFGASATIGGTIACGLSGPARPYRGAARDFVLGVNCVNGKGQYLRFGGQVIKNVAGYDLSRVMTGALGTLGIITEISLKVLPLPEVEQTLCFECTQSEALSRLGEWALQPWPFSGTAFFDGVLRLRLSGSGAGVAAAATALGGEPCREDTDFWHDLREHRLQFFASDLPLWRLSLPPQAPPVALAEQQLLEWGGGQRWLASEAQPQQIFAAAAAVGGHATRFRGGDRANSFQPLDAVGQRLHTGLKAAFDPVGILNRDRLYPEA